MNSEVESNGVIESQKLLFVSNNIDVENRIAKDIVVKADKLRLAELFNNLITNAVKYMGASGGKITLDAKKDNYIVTVSISYTGLGMTKEQ